MKKSEKEEYEKKIKELEEKVRKLKEEEEEGGVNEILKNVGNMFGLGELIKSVQKIPEFQERLKKIDEELKRRLREVPLEKEGGLGRRILRGIPPRKRLKRKVPAAGKPVVKEEVPPVAEEREPDIFDEEKRVLVVAEIPGADEEKIEVKLEKDKLTISADGDGEKYRKELKLPCIPKGKISKTYKNEVLEIKIMKQAKERS